MVIQIPTPMDDHQDRHHSPQTRTTSKVEQVISTRNQTTILSQVYHTNDK
jgi:hypothetical protein